MSMPGIDCIAPCCMFCAIAVSKSDATTDTHLQQSVESHNRPGISPASTGEMNRKAPITIENLRRVIAAPY